jgi:hypothetical protein
MTELTVGIPKLPKLDQEDIRAVRSFFPGERNGRNGATMHAVDFWGDDVS